LQALQKAGHSRDECWSLNGRSENSKDKQPEIEKKKYAFKQNSDNGNETPSPRATAAKANKSKREGNSRGTRVLRNTHEIRRTHTQRWANY